MQITCGLRDLYLEIWAPAHTHTAFIALVIPDSLVFGGTLVSVLIWLINYETVEESHTQPGLSLNAKFCRLKYLDLHKRGLKGKKLLFISLLHQIQVLSVVQSVTVYNVSVKTCHWFVILIFYRSNHKSCCWDKYFATAALKIVEFHETEGEPHTFENILRQCLQLVLHSEGL